MLWRIWTHLSKVRSRHLNGTLRSVTVKCDITPDSSTKSEAGPMSQSLTLIPASSSSYFKEGDRVVLRQDMLENEHFDARFFAPAENEVVTGVVVFALPASGGEEQRCVLVAREGDSSYQNAFFFRGSHLQHASEPCVFRRGDRVRLSQPRSAATAPSATAVICRNGHACVDFRYDGGGGGVRGGRRVRGGRVRGGGGGGGGGRGHSCQCGVCGSGISANSPGCMRCDRCDYDVCAECVIASSASSSAPQPAPPTGCIANPDTYGVVVNTGSVRDGFQRNVLVVCCQTGEYSLYPASALVHCSSSLRISSDSEQDSLADHLVRLNPSSEQIGMGKTSIKGLVSQFGSKIW
jgi:hypothetical protein